MEDLAPMPAVPRRRRILSRVLLAAAVCGLGAYLWQEREALAALPPLDRGWLALAFGLNAFNLTGYVLLQHDMTRRYVPDLAGSEYAAAVLTGQALNLVLPARGGIAFVGAYLYKKHRLEPARFLAVIAAYHVLLIAGTAGFGAVCAGYLAASGVEPQAAGLLAAALGLVAVATVASCAAMGRWGGRLPARAQKLLAPGLLAARLFSEARPAAQARFAATMAGQCAALVAAVYCTHRALGFSAGVAEIGVSRMAGSLAAVFSVVPQGLGVMEAAIAATGRLVRVAPLVTVSTMLVTRVMFNLSVLVAGLVSWLVALRGRGA